MGVISISVPMDISTVVWETVVVAMDQYRRVCLIRQFRHAAGGWIWEFPAGLLEHDESPVTAAKRELREETGYLADTWVSLGSTLSTPGFCTERLYIFLATDLQTGSAEPEQHEFIEVHWFELDEVIDMARRGEIEDAKTIVALFRMAGRETD